MRKGLLTLFTLCFLGLSAGVVSAQAPKMRGTAVQGLQYHRLNQPISLSSTPLPGGQATTKKGKGGSMAGLAKAGPCDTIFYEDFQNQTIPATWGNLDIDGNTDANGRPQNFYINFDALTTTPGDTNWACMSSSWFTPFAQANNWLITDSFTVCDPNLFLLYKSAPFEGPTFADGYKVLISTTTAATSSFTDTLAVFAESVNGTAAQTAGIQHPNYNGTNGILTEFSFSLAAYANQTIYIAFVHDSDDDNLIMFDDISVVNLPDYDMEMVASDYNPPYTLIPLPQAPAFTFDGVIQNNGLPPATNPRMRVTVVDTSLNQYWQDSAGIASLAGGADTALAISPGTWTPTCLGTYGFYYEALADQADPISDNDSLLEVVTITDSVYARDDGIITGDLSIGGTSGGELGQQFDILQNATLSSISFFLTGPTNGDTAVGKVYTLAGGVPSAVVGTTGPILLDSAINFYTVPFPTALNLTPGTYVIVLEETVSGSLTLGTTSTIFRPNTTWVFFGGNWSNNEDFQFLVSYVLRANFSDAPCATPVASFTDTAAGTQVSFTNTTPQPACDIMWDFGDGTTSTEENPSHTYSAGGSYTVCLMVTNDCGSDTICNTLLVNCAVPVASWNASVVNRTATFTDISTNGPTSWGWDFGDGNTSTVQNPSHTYAMNGTYIACLTIGNACGADTICDTIVISCPNPVAGFSSSVSGITATFTESSVNALAYDWDFGDGNTSTVPNPTHNYAGDGTFTVCLIASSACGSDTTCDTVTICQTPTAGFTPSAITVQTGDSILFSNNSTGGTNPTYSWDFGDGNSSTAMSPTHVYATPNSYQVCLTVTNACGTDSTCQTFSILVGLEEGAFGGMDVYPNPSTGKFNVNVEGITARDLTLKVVNLIGASVFTETEAVSGGRYQTEINLEGQPAGIYFLVVETNGQRAIRKLILD